jgi:hypothetical protein
MGSPYLRSSGFFFDLRFCFGPPTFLRFGDQFGILFSKNSALTDFGFSFDIAVFSKSATHLFHFNTWSLSIFLYFQMVVVKRIDKIFTEFQ